MNYCVSTFLVFLRKAFELHVKRGMLHICCNLRKRKSVTDVHLCVHKRWAQKSAQRHIDIVYKAIVIFRNVFR